MGGVRASGARAQGAREGRARMGGMARLHLLDEIALELRAHLLVDLLVNILVKGRAAPLVVLARHDSSPLITLVKHGRLGDRIDRAVAWRAVRGARGRGGAVGHAERGRPARAARDRHRARQRPRPRAAPPPPRDGCPHCEKCTSLGQDAVAFAPMRSTRNGTVTWIISSLRAPPGDCLPP